MILSAGALFFFEKKILVLKPSYRNYWLFPGGIVEDNESPREACAREVREETGLEVGIGQLLCVDYLPPGTIVGIQGDMREKQEAEITFQFFGCDFSVEQVPSIRMDGKEVSDFKFLSVDQAIPLLPNYLRNRLPYCLRAIETDRVYYLENGKLSPSPESG